MAKRSAESQLTKDSRSDDEDDSGDQTGFKRADDKTLSGRVIRGMPKRAGGTPAASPAPVSGGAPDTPTPPPRFSGFGSLVTASPASSSAPTSSPFSFASKPFPEATTSAFPPAKEPSATSKAFASFLSANPTPPTTPTTDGAGEDLFKYYKQLRGLNVSLIEACKKALAVDPFADLTQVFSQYSDHRASIERARPAAATSTVGVSSKTTNGTSASAPPPVADLKLPSVPPSFSFSPFPSAVSSSPAKPTSTNSPAFPAFTPPVVSTSTATAGGSSASPFSLSSDSPASPPKPSFAPAADTKSTISFGDDNSKSSFAFGSASASAEDKSSKSMFNFGGPPSSTGATSLFSFGDSSKSGETKPPSLFSSSSVGFGSSSLFSSPSTTPAPTDSPAKPATPFGGFGSSSSFGSTQSLFGGAKGSLGNPVGFSFGATGKAADGGGGTPEPAEESASRELTPAAGGGVDTIQDGAGVVLEPSAYDKEGAGEEDEDTVYEERCKAYRLDKKDGKMEWVDLGIGIFRCKKHKTTDSRRILMRNSGSGRIILNFGVFASLKPTLQKNVISFVAMDGSTPASFRIKVKSESMATQLRDAVLKEVDAVAAKS